LILCFSWLGIISIANQGKEFKIQIFCILFGLQKCTKVMIEHDIMAASNNLEQFPKKGLFIGVILGEI
jgi:hypothetical protein